MRSTWTQKWMPTEDWYVKSEDPSRHADLVVDGSGDTTSHLIFLAQTGLCQ